MFEIFKFHCKWCFILILDQILFNIDQIKEEIFVNYYYL